MPDASKESPQPEKPAKPAAAADAAVAEVEAEEDSAASDTVEVTHAGVSFTVSRKRLNSVQFRRLMQRNRDIIALEWLLTPVVVTQLIDAMADSDGVTSDEDFDKIYETIGEAAGAGNS